MKTLLKKIVEYMTAAAILIGLAAVIPEVYSAAWNISVSAYSENDGYDADALESAADLQPETSSSASLTYSESLTVEMPGGYVPEANDQTVTEEYNESSDAVEVTGTEKDASDLTVSAIADQTYTGSPITPAVTVKYGSKVLASGTDYSISYSNNTAAGTATVTVTCKGSYSGKATATFKILPRNISECTISAIPDKTYTGSAITPALTIKYGTKSLTAGTSFSAAYKNNTAAGTATVTVTGKKNYTGTAAVTFRILPRNISECTISAIPDKTYTGSAITPALTIKYGTKSLTAGTSYSVTYKNNTVAGTATVTVTGMKNYTGTTTVTFNIVRRNISSCTISAIPDKTYTGSEIKPALTITYGTKTLTAGTSYSVTYKNNTAAGTATVTVTGLKNYTGTTSVTFKINPKEISDCTISGIADQTYTGSQIMPAVTVKSGSKVFESGVDYSISYSNNTAAGTATATVTFKGNYTGKKAAAFKILPRNISDCTISGIADQTYTGSAIKPALTIKYGTKSLTAGTSYSVVYKNNTAAGTATVTITGLKNYTGTKTVTFKILPRNINDCTISGLVDQTYTGSAITPALTVKYGTKSLTNGTSYTASYKNNTAAGTATVTVTGLKNYTGTTTATFRILPRSISECTISAISDKQYTGSAITPALTIKYGTKTLTAGTSYSVTYKSNIAIGTASVTVKGLKNYTGTKTVTFKIVCRNISSCTISAIEDQTYTGSPIDPDITISYSDITLAEGTDYTVSYENNTEAGKASVTITGIGKYTGTKTAAFKILPRNISECTISAISDKTYTSSAITPALTVRYGTKALIAGTNYSVAYKNNISVGTATVTVKGLNNYTGTTTVTFKINPKNISNCTISVIPNRVLYTGKAITPVITVKNGDKTITNGTSYEVVTYSNNVEVGKATVTIKGKGNFDGTATAVFYIDSNAPKVTAEVSNKAVKLKWNSVAGAEYYRVYRINNSAKELIANNLDKTEYVDTGLTNGTEYTYLVQSYVDGTWNVVRDSDYVKATPRMPSPSKLVCTSSNLSLDLAWDQLNNFGSDDIYFTLTWNVSSSVDAPESITFNKSASGNYYYKSGTAEVQLQIQSGLLTYKLSGLANETKYTIILETFVAGESIGSSETTGMPIKSNSDNTNPQH